MEDNIVFFPKLKDRIISLGKKALEEKKYGQALILCDQLREMNQHTSQTELAAVACLLEVNRAKDAKIRCEELVFGPFESDEAIEIYISILFQLKEYEVLQVTIKKLLKQKRIDENQLDKYQAMLSLSNKVVSDRGNKQNELIILQSLAENDSSINKQLEIINELRLIDCNLMINQIKKVLRSSKANPLIKSFVMFILQEQSVDEDFEVIKMNQKMIWNSTKDLIEHDLFVDTVLKRLSDVLESEDPSAFEMAKTHFQHFVTIYFPFIPMPSNEDVWASCFYSIVQEYFDRDMTEDELRDLFGVNRSEMQSALNIVRDFEKEGYFDLNGL